MNIKIKTIYGTRMSISEIFDQFVRDHCDVENTGGWVKVKDLLIAFSVYYYLKTGETLNAYDVCSLAKSRIKNVLHCEVAETLIGVTLVTFPRKNENPEVEKFYQRLCQTTDSQDQEDIRDKLVMLQRMDRVCVDSIQKNMLPFLPTKQQKEFLSIVIGLASASMVEESYDYSLYHVQRFIENNKLLINDHMIVLLHELCKKNSKTYLGLASDDVAGNSGVNVMNKIKTTIENMQELYDQTKCEYFKTQANAWTQWLDMLKDDVKQTW